MKRIYLPLFFSFLQLTSPVFAQSVLNISTSVAEGRTGDIPKVTVWQGTGLSLNFGSTGEHIVKAWLDDPSKLTVDFDVPICNGTCDSGAAVIHLRRIRAMSFEHLPDSANTLLTVVTGSNQTKKVYYFRVYYGKNEPAKYIAININTDIRPALKERQRLEANTREKTERIEKGLKIAKEKSTDKNNAIVFERVENLIAHVRLGMSFSDALHLENLSPSVLEKLESLANSTSQGADKSEGGK